MKRSKALWIQQQYRVRYWGGPLHLKWSPWAVGQPPQEMVHYRYDNLAASCRVLNDPIRHVTAQLKATTAIYRLVNGRYVFQGKRVAA